MRKNHTDAGGSFWHCARCGTPNPSAAYLTQCLGCGEARPARPKTVVSAPAAPSRQPGRRWTSVFTMAYAVLILIVLVLMRWQGDRWWLATPLLYGPRWVWLMPLPVLAAFAWRAGSRRLWAWQIATALVVLGAMMGFSAPWSRWIAATPVGPRVRLLNLNLGHLPIDRLALQRLIDQERIDIVCLQEAQVDDPVGAVFSVGWEHDQRRSIYSRYPIVEELPPSDLNAFREIGQWPVHLTRVRVRLPEGRVILVANAHMPTMRQGFVQLWKEGPGGMDRFIAWRWEQLGALAGALAESRAEPILLSGDLNTPPDSPLMSLLHHDYRDAFEIAGWGYGYTRPASFPWIRIDHVLANANWTFTRCWVGPDVASDHRPVIAEAVLAGSERPLPK